MLKTLCRYGVALLALTALSLLHAEDLSQKKVYECTWSNERLATPASWVQSKYFNNPKFKEVRFEDYGKAAAAALVTDANVQRNVSDAAIPPGGARETSFYMVYREDGLYIYFQSNEPETGKDGQLKDSSLEIYLSPGVDDVPYYQMIVSTSTGATDYFDWQTENRHYRPLKGYLQVDSKQVPGGWGTVLYVPWDAIYDKLPLDGAYWRFSVMRWAPSGAFTWGGQVHETGRFHLIHFQPPTPEQRVAMQKYVLAKAWAKYQGSAQALTAFWSTNPATRDDAFYRKSVEPLLAQLTAAGATMPQLAQLNAADTETLFRNAAPWMEVTFTVEDLRAQYVRTLLLKP